MSGKIRITAGRVRMEAGLNNSETAALIRENLPLKGRVNTWGEEIYFEIPLAAEHEDAVSVVEEGDIAYWPEGKSFCIFFGKTPLSTPAEIRPASPVNPVGKLLGDPKAWKAVSPGTEIILEQA